MSESPVLSPPVLTQRDGAVLTVTLNLPDRRNPISDPAMVDALCDVFEAADRDASIHVAILTGAGSAFSSGGDLNAMRPDAGGLRASLPAQTRRNYRAGIQRLPLLFQAIELPVIAAVNGPAIGAGLDLACMCDLRIAGQGARFAESFVKLGLVSGDGGAWLLPRIIGFSKASQLSLTGETIDAGEALRIGLVGDVVPNADLMTVARAQGCDRRQSAACDADDQTVAACGADGRTFANFGNGGRHAGAGPRDRGS
ncbi:Enoyl-CoA hydratase/carnithine racemase [Sphingobium yanoikuyae]|uniref:Enoyl-CoA hydratase/carnithine racemase n=1 Tax=Sphingobium yanoikuyae TaxID=13690 RepID=A0A084EMZ7_SPHYA|nr:Enoyl-CoA hydratase/carnithine racemase [Sphingobium yanoikuyae]